MLTPLWSSFLLVAAAEMGDKTQLLAFSLAARFRKPWPILAGILTATLLNHALASWAGAWITGVVRPDIMAWALGISFIGFGIWTLFPDSMDDPERKSRFGPFLTTTILFFLAEMGDKTQLATIALGARFEAPWAVTAGTTLGMLAANGPAVFLGEKIARYISMKWMRRGAAGLFFVFGGWSLFRAMTLNG